MQAAAPIILERSAGWTPLPDGEDGRVDRTGRWLCVERARQIDRQAPKQSGQGVEFFVRPEIAEQSGGLLGERLGAVLGEAAAGWGEHYIADAAVARILGAVDPTDFLHRCKHASDAGLAEIEALGQVDAAQAAARRLVEMHEQHQFVDGEAVHAAEFRGEPVLEVGLGTDQAQDCVQGRSVHAGYYMRDTCARK